MPYSVFESISDAVVISDKEGVIHWINHQTVTLFGYPYDELVGASIEKLLPYSVRAAHLQYRTKYLEAPTIRKMSNRVALSGMTKSGQAISIDVGLGLIEMPEGQRVIATVRSIDSRLVAEAEQWTAEERFNLAIEGAGDGIWDWNLQTQQMQFSPLYRELLGYADNNNFFIDFDMWLKSLHPDDINMARRMLDDYISGKKTRYTVQIRQRCKNGDYKWILCRGTIVAKDSDGKPTRMVGVNTDITAQKQTEIALVSACKAAEEANKNKSLFLAKMSHELRTPLNAIIGFAQMLEMGSLSPLQEIQKEPVGHILSSGRHLLSLINDSLDLSNIELGQLDLKEETFPLTPLVNEIEGTLRDLAASHGMVIQHERDETINITADKTRTRQILFNLVSNAVKYASSGGYVALSYQQLGSMVRIIVSDSGAGISQSHQLYVFQPFQRLGAENTPTEGSGIGLAICKQLAEAMNGHIGFESKEGVGSHFWVELPAAAVALSAESRCIAENLPLPPKNILGKVIYIEDNPVNLNVMRHLFKSIPNVELLTAHNAEKGLVMIRGNLPDMILMDIGLPGISGLDALKILKSDLRTAEIPVIAISGLAMPSHIKEGIAAGFSAYHTKPFDVSVLLAQIKLFLTLNKKTALP